MSSQDFFSTSGQEFFQQKRLGSWFLPAGIALGGIRDLSFL
jgi:hypothetical protein